MDQPSTTLELAATAVERLRAARLHITTVESCTGGALASRLTDISGASDVLKDSFVTYSDEAKRALGIPPDVFASFGVYSPHMARAMAEAGLRASAAADIAVGITGQLPEDGAASVDVAVSGLGKNIGRHLALTGPDRPALKDQIVRAALEMIIGLLETAR